MIEITPAYLASQGLSPTFPQRFWAKVRKTDDCWLWTGYLNKAGYGRIWKGLDRRRGWLLAHVAGWILHFGPTPKGLCVLHHCDIPACVNWKHLWIGSPADNAHDRDTKGRHVALPGELNGQSKLTAASVIAIREAYASGQYSQFALANRFGVSERNIFFIVHKQHWKHI